MTRPLWVGLLALTALCGSALLVLAAPAAPAEPIAVAILKRRCWSCHGGSKIAGLDLRSRAGALRGGGRGPSLVPGNPEASPLYTFASGKGSLKMPPGSTLPAAEQAALRAWIIAGAPWPGDGGTGDDVWWSLRPLRRPPLPRVRNAAWVRTPIDTFVLAGLEARGLRPAAPAEPRELVRRVYFDLWGLPPKPEEVEAFVADRSPLAYDKLIDRLLASPRYGERWARHWLDVARFAESQGFERDKIRDHAWRYRDWVIQALNEDLPYHRFVQQQVAGDVLPGSDGRSTVATGFLVAGPWDEVGAQQASSVMKARVREDELEDMVSAVSQTFLGLTVNCARCHDHKFDPIPQRDYYRLESALSGVRHGDRDITTPDERAGAERQLRPLRQDLREAQERVNALLQVGRERALERLAAAQPPAPDPAPAPALRWTFDGTLRDSVRGVALEPFGGAQTVNGRLRLDGKDDQARTAALPITLAERTLEVWLTLPTLDQAGGGALTLEDVSGRVFDAIVFGERQPRKWLAGSDAYQRSLDLDAPTESVAPGVPVHVAISYASDGAITVYRNGRAYAAPYRPPAGLQTYTAGQARIALGLRHSAGARPGDGRWLQAEIDEARVYDRSLTPAEVAASFRAGPPTITDADVLAAFTEAEGAELADRRKAIPDLTARIEALSRPSLAYCANPSLAPTIRVLKRGDVGQPGDEVAPGGLSCLPGLPGDFGVPPNAPEADRRRALAAWITDARNPLTPRVMVNRVWQHHFGRGIVASSNDFGINGEAPTHPLLLDWLAATFSGPGKDGLDWSLKRLHRLILRSSTYRQASAFNPRAATVDTDNHLLWRMAPRRLEAEEVRDAMLAVSGQLNLGDPGKEGGPGFRPFSVVVNNSHFYTFEDRLGPDYNRRSIYRCVVNSGGVPLLEALDCPDPSVKTPRRGSTTTPLQALALLNNSFVLRQAREMALRVEAAVGKSPSRQVDRAYHLTVARHPTAAERARDSAFVARFGLAAYCRVLLNASEFVYVR